MNDDRARELEAELAKVKEQWEYAAKAQVERSERAEATMREVAEELRNHSKRGVVLYRVGMTLADRLDPEV